MKGEAGRPPPFFGLFRFGKRIGVQKSEKKFFRNTAAVAFVRTAHGHSICGRTD